MKLPRFLANIVRHGSSPELVTRRNFDDLASTLTAYANEIEAQGEAFSDLKTKFGKLIPPAILGKGVVWDVRSFGTIQKAVTYFGSSTATLYITNEQAITTNLTVPSNISLVVVNGGSFAISTGVTLTINGDFQGGLNHIFTGSGTVAFGPLAVHSVLPEWWGAGNADPDDDTYAIQTALDTGKNIEFLPWNTYFLNASITGFTANQRLGGDGACIKRADDSIDAWPIIDLGGGDTIESAPFFLIDVDGVRLEGLELDGNKANNGMPETDDKGDCVILRGASRCGFFQNYFHDFARDMISIGHGSDDNIIRGNWFWNIGLSEDINGGNGVAIVGGSRNVTFGNDFRGDPTNSTDAVAAYDVEPNEVTDTCEGNVFEGNAVDFVRLGQGIACYQNDTNGIAGTSRNNVYKGNVVYASDPALAGKYAFQCRNGWDLKVQGNSFWHGATYCVSISGAYNYRMEFSGNYVMESDGVGINIPNNLYDSKIEWNTIRNHDGDGLLVNATERGKFNNNHISVCGGRGATISTGSFNQVFDNLVYDVDEDGIRLYGLLYSRFSRNYIIDAGKGTNNTYAALQISGNCDFLRISDSVLGSQSGTTNKVNYCVSESGSGTSGSLILANNQYLNYAGSDATNLNTAFPTQFLDEYYLSQGRIFEVRGKFMVRYGTGSPEGAAAGRVGSLYHQTDGDSGRAVWVKNRGTGNTGWDPLSVLEKNTYFRSAVPSSGDWVKGDIVINSSPDDGEFAIAQCTSSGTPGTWRVCAWVNSQWGDDISISVAGKGLKVKEGSNARMGTATLVGGTVVVNNTSVTANTRILYSVQAPGGTQGHLSVARTAATSFTFTSTSATDTSTLAWILVEPA